MQKTYKRDNFGLITSQDFHKLDNLKEDQFITQTYKKNEKKPDENKQKRAVKGPRIRSQRPSHIHLREFHSVLNRSGRDSENSIDVLNRNNKNIDLYRTVGILNNNNDCFINAALQCLFCVPEFVEFFVNKEYLRTEKMQNGLSNITERHEITRT